MNETMDNGSINHHQLIATTTISYLWQVTANATNLPEAGEVEASTITNNYANETAGRSNGTQPNTTSRSTEIVIL